MDIQEAVNISANSRRQYYENIPGYLESDNDFVRNNIEIAVWSIENWDLIKRALNLLHHTHVLGGYPLQKESES